MFNKRLLQLTGSMLALLALPAVALAADAPKIDSGNTAWMLASTALVLFMTVPGLSMFYAGMVRSKNALSVFMQCFAITSLVTLLWYLFGYSMSFSTDGMAKGVTNLYSFVGGFGKAMLHGLTKESIAANGVPESVFITFQMTFAIITPALIVGAFAERMKFSAMLIFMGLWVTLVYFPICHMAWAGDGGLYWDWGVLDFAGGTVVHINAGIAGLVAALVLGKRKGFPRTPMPPHNVTYTIIGAGMLWVGWFGFNAGSAVAADGNAGMAMLVTQIATGVAALAWMFTEWLVHGKPSVLGIASGAVAGLVAITPASGFVAPFGAMMIGIAAGVLCYLAASKLKRALGYDDSLDVFGVHAIGGIIGALLTGIFGIKAGGGFADGASIAAGVWTQAKAVLVTVIWCGVVSFILLKVVGALVGLRVAEEQEQEGLDIVEHDEKAYNIG